MNTTQPQTTEHSQINDLQQVQNKMDLFLEKLDYLMDGLIYYRFAVFVGIILIFMTSNTLFNFIVLIIILVILLGMRKFPHCFEQQSNCNANSNITKSGGQEILRDVPKGMSVPYMDRAKLDDFKKKQL